jgi:hypothetical protein
MQWYILGQYCDNKEYNKNNKDNKNKNKEQKYKDNKNNKLLIYLSIEDANIKKINFIN